MFKAKLRLSVGSIERTDGSITSDDLEIAEILYSFFSSIFTNENLLDVPSLGIKYSGESLSSIQVFPECVWKQLCKLNPSKSAGPDHCHPSVFQEVKEK